jgi:hypothetical protein
MSRRAGGCRRGASGRQASAPWWGSVPRPPSWRPASGCWSPPGRERRPAPGPPPSIRASPAVISTIPTTDRPPRRIPPPCRRPVTEAGSRRSRSGGGLGLSSVVLPSVPGVDRREVLGIRASAGARIDVGVQQVLNSRRCGRPSAADATGRLHLTPPCSLHAPASSPPTVIHQHPRVYPRRPPREPLPRDRASAGDESGPPDPAGPRRLYGVPPAASITAGFTSAVCEPGRTDRR